MKRYLLPLSVAVLVAGGVATQFAGAAAERTLLTPMPAVDVPAAGHSTTAIFAGGCFWGMEAVFSHVKGVTSVLSGYAGGTRDTANYDTVSTETTRHAEAIKVTYDPARVSYGTLLRVMFSVAMDPTELNRQGPDTGTSYRSAIFPQSPDQARVAKAYIGQVSASKVWGAPIVTKLETGGFYPAEAYHQNFAALNPNHGYIRMWDAPKLVALQKTFPALWQARPVS
jgi:peptide-methionine (S)-S-oxide reductase